MEQWENVVVNYLATFPSLFQIKVFFRFLDARTMWPLTMCPRTKSLECSIPWTMRPLDVASLIDTVCTDPGPHRDTCRISTQYISVIVCPAMPTQSYTTYLSIRSICPKGSGHIVQGRIIEGKHRPRDVLTKGRIIHGTQYPRDKKSQTEFSGTHCLGIFRPITGSMKQFQQLYLKLSSFCWELFHMENCSIL
jgi:hypothetical protein